jgi:hypothetical protein
VGTSLGGRLVAAKPRLKLLAVPAATLVERSDAGGGAFPQRSEDPDAQRQGDHDREQQGDDDWKVTKAEQVPDPEDHCCQDDDEYQPGQDVDQHINDKAGSGSELRHGPSLQTARVYSDKGGFCVAYLLLMLVLAGLIYAGWRLTRATVGRPKTRVIGPDDDPDFLRRLGHGDNPRPK